MKPPAPLRTYEKTERMNVLLWRRGEGGGWANRPVSLIWEQSVSL